MKTKTTKLKTKDLIVAGAFAALYVVVLFIVVSVLGLVPILYIMAPFFMSIALGAIYMMYVTKVPKAGAILILAVAVGLMTSTGGVWVSMIWCAVCGLIAEGIARLGKYKSKLHYRLSFIVFGCTNMAPFWLVVTGKKEFIDQCKQYYSIDYANAVDKLTPSWIIFVLIGIAAVGAIIGGALGSKLLKKHFEKAGVV